MEALAFCAGKMNQWQDRALYIENKGGMIAQVWREADKMGNVCGEAEGCQQIEISLGISSSARRLLHVNATVDKVQKL